MWRKRSKAMRSRTHAQRRRPACVMSMHVCFPPAPRAVSASLRCLDCARPDRSAGGCGSRGSCCKMKPPGGSQQGRVVAALWGLPLTDHAHLHWYHAHPMGSRLPSHTHTKPHAGSAAQPECPPGHADHTARGSMSWSESGWPGWRHRSIRTCVQRVGGSDAQTQRDHFLQSRPVAVRKTVSITACGHSRAQSMHTGFTNITRPPRSVWTSSSADGVAPVQPVLQMIAGSIDPIPFWLASRPISDLLRTLVCTVLDQASPADRVPKSYRLILKPSEDEKMLHCCVA